MFSEKINEGEKRVKCSAFDLKSNEKRDQYRNAIFMAERLYVKRIAFDKMIIDSITIDSTAIDKTMFDSITIDKKVFDSICWPAKRQYCEKNNHPFTCLRMANTGELGFREWITNNPHGRSCKRLAMFPVGFAGISNIVGKIPIRLKGLNHNWGDLYDCRAEKNYSMTQVGVAT